MKRILVVDDNDDILYVVQALLESAGFEVIALPQLSPDAAEVSQFGPDLVLLDMMLGDMDGRDLCRVIKTHPKLHDIPVVMFSASQIAREDVLTYGADDFIAKPFDINELLTKIHALVVEPAAW